ncbi:hypothetical protein HX773_18405 [Pantoea sp. B9002]|uniref:hypothetical protein n=1 Tax=Pantoea sp. B9002 TaxID=2726979 RepID=UPI00159F95AD|nr:hypothetical protein [Pantoea sp. B9002]NWA62879.1 hypothetical protein [Pantoea sp. B9002]
MEFKRFIENYFPNVNAGSHIEYDYVRDFISPDNQSFSQVLSWPPNIFLILHSVIDYTDKYRLLVSPQSHINWGLESNLVCDELVKSWKSYLDNTVSSKGSFIDVDFILKNHINSIFNQRNMHKCVYDLMNENVFCESLFSLLISIDKLFSKFSGTYLHDEIYAAMIARDINYKIYANDNPSFDSSLTNLSDNDPKYGIITRKFNTPQSGLTINNLTQNLTFIRPAVKYTHHINKVEKSTYSKSSFNILMIPWPFDVKDEYFTASKNIKNHMDEYFDFFDYHPKDDFEESHFLSFLLSAIKRVGVIDLIVFPECSLSEIQFKKLTKLLYEIFDKDAPSLLSGVYGTDGINGKNAAVLGFVDEDLLSFNTIVQEKHHRWFLDRNQLRNYNLSASLNPGKKWWENISVGRRNLTTLETAEGVILCPLVCEDLARQEPVAQAVRAIGPNLVISLLLDGPQIAPRWPGKYAAVLSDDPGCSVLSVTALGMTLRATGLGHAPSKDVALWSEPGKPSETLQVSSTSGALVIELDLETTNMWSLDGRNEIKPILRKKMHTTLELEFKNRSIRNLKRMITTALEAGGNYVR